MILRSRIASGEITSRLPANGRCSKNSAWHLSPSARPSTGSGTTMYVRRRPPAPA